jgi:WASH complex subunit strumpellin
VRQVVPRTVVELLDRIVTLQTEGIAELPSRLEKGRLRDYAQLEQRYELAALTHRIAALAQGVLAMERCARV